MRRISSTTNASRYICHLRGEGKVQYERFDGKIYKRDDAVNPPVILSAEEAATSLQ